jgi:hypothetical protein
VLRGPDGRDRTLWRARRSYAAGATTFDVSEDGTFVSWRRTSFALQTRRRDGRPEGRLRQRVTGHGVWRITTTGRRADFPLRGVPADADVTVDVPVGPHGWSGLVRDARDRYSTVTVDRTGAVRPVLLGGRPITGRRLVSALGLPSPASGDDPTFAAIADLVTPSGYESATDSLVTLVFAGEGEHVQLAVARVPLAGGAPTLVRPTAKPGREESVLTLVTAW